MCGRAGQVQLQPVRCNDGFGAHVGGVKWVNKLLTHLLTLWQPSGGMDTIDDFPNIGFNGTNECDVGEILDHDFSRVWEDVADRHAHGKNIHFFNLREDSALNGVGDISVGFHFVPDDNFFQTLECKVRPFDRHA